MDTVTRARRLEGFLAGLSGARFRAAVYITTTALFLLGVWLHLPYGGGHIYSDLVHIFQNEVCPPPENGSFYSLGSSVCIIRIPYIQSFMEYPVLVSMFVYVNAVFGNLFSGDLLTNYYLWSSLLLFFPTLLAVRELLKLVEMRGASRNRVLWYFIVTPTFIYMTLLNWYIIGVFFSLFGIRKYLQGSRVASGLLFGLSAASNFVTAVPALGLLIASKGVRERFLLAASALGTYAMINAPFVLINPKQWSASFAYIYAWNIEDSWMQAILPSLYSPERHYIPPVVFGMVIAIMVWLRLKRRTDDPLVFAFISMFGYAFSSYIYTPQMNLILLPFFVLLPVSNSYLEFLAFDIMNALIIILGFSQALLPLGITYPAHTPIDRGNIVYWIEVIRSLWEGRFTFFNGAWSIRSPDRGKREGGVNGGPLQAGEHRPI
jgi:predicted CDP-diglyceride synthetase/phosphatidate cytidylyltransferase